MPDYNNSDTQDDNEMDFSEMGALEFAEVVSSADNLVEQISDRVKAEWSEEIKLGYDVDKASMKDWIDHSEKGIELATLLKEEKNYPFPGASNVKYPLIVSAALQYNARAYPAIVPSGDPIMCTVHGNDPQGLKAARGQRVSTYGSFQLKTENNNWEEDTDKLTFIGPIVGSMFRKYWYDPATDAQRSRLCDPGAVILDNNIHTLEDAPRISEEFGLWPHEVAERKNSGIFANIELSDDDLPTKEKRVEFIEQHCRYDLDDDGYPEPYIVTIHKADDVIVRVVAAFDMDDVRVSQDDTPKILAIKASTYFIHYPFLPSFDGTFLGSGFGLLLGDLSETANTMINMIVDSAHFAAQPSGFIGAKDFQIKGGATRFNPGEWKTVHARGGDIRNGLVELSVPQPSPILFQVLGMMIDASKEVSSTSSIMTGDAGNANMPVGTVMALIEQGMQMFTASYKRIYRSLKKEFALLSRLNVRYLSVEKYSAFFDEMDEEGQPVQLNPTADFDLSNMDITPVADPKSVTDMQKMAKAQFLLDLAEKGMVDQGAAITRILDAAGIEDRDELIPQANPMDEQMQQMTMLSMKADLQLKAAQVESEIAKASASNAKAIKDMSDAEAQEAGAQMNEYLQVLQALKTEIEVGQQQLTGMMQPPQQ